MSSFIEFRDAINSQFTKMIKAGEVYKSNASKEELKSTYLDAFPEGTNPVYLTNTTHDCNCCFQFIRSIGNTLSVQNGKLVSVWDVQVGGYYQVVANTMAVLVKSAGILNVFRSSEKNISTRSNASIDAAKLKTFDHFYYDLPSSLILSKYEIGTFLGKKATDFSTLKRALKEISPEAIEMILDLISQNSLYKGAEFKRTLKEMSKALKTYKTDLDVWTILDTNRNLAGFRNSVIGTLATDISDGVDLEDAVKAYEFKTAPTNYKRPTALITAGMIKKAEEKTKELGIESSLQRRYAIIDDISINDILFADNSVKKSMGLFDELKNSTSDKLPSLDKVQEITIDKFIEDVLPKAESLELLVTNDKEKSLFSLIAPEDASAPSILKWDNNFSWSYNGDVTDSIKENVKNAGGKVNGVLRFSIQWNDNNDNKNDLDAHAKLPQGYSEIYFGNKRSGSGTLDVDIMSPGNKVAVENIIFSDIKEMPVGDYLFFVHNYSGRNGKNFTAQIEFNNEIFDFNHNGSIRYEGKYPVATVNLDKNGKFTMKSNLSGNKSVKEIWGITTQKFHKVDMVMLSPNYWNNQTIGNKHYLFALEGCTNPDSTRGFYNEFLSQELHENRKVFEVLGSKMKVPHSKNQLSGLGFSSTLSNEVICRVKGTFNRILKIKF
jgi:hypothetical protein